MTPDPFRIERMQEEAMHLRGNRRRDPAMLVRLNRIETELSQLSNEGVGKMRIGSHRPHRES